MTDDLGGFDELVIPVLPRLAAGGIVERVQGKPVGSGTDKGDARVVSLGARFIELRQDRLRRLMAERDNDDQIGANID